MFLMLLLLGTVCLPPGIPALETLHVVGQQFLLAPLDDDSGTIRSRAVALAPNGAERAAYILYWLPGPDGWQLAAVDDHPDQPVPDFRDTGMVDEQGRARVDRAPSCHWERLGAGDAGHT